MPQYLSPGVYVEEVDSGSRPIEGVGTAVAAFVGLASQGPTDVPILVTNWGQFSQTFGDFVEGSYLAHAVYGYFLNGGGSCYVIRVGGGANGNQPAPAKAELTSGSEAAKVGAYRVTALKPGDVGNELTIEIPPPEEGAPDDTFKLIVKRGVQIAEEFDGLTTKRGKQNAVTVVNAQSKLIKLEEAADGGTLARPAPGSTSLIGRRRPVGADHPRCRPTTTSATPPIGPASVASRPSTRSRW